MRLLLCLLAAIALASCTGHAGAQDKTTRPPPPGMSATVPFDAHILVDQFGYLPQDQKVAVVRNPRVGYDAGSQITPGRHYEVRRASDGKAVFAGGLTPWNRGAVEASSGDAGWWFDFSKVDAPDTYFVFDADRKVRSATFRIDPHVYRDILKAAMRMYFYQRSSFAKQKPFAESCWADTPAYLNPNQDSAARDITARDDASRVRNVAGGWFDAGDTNKYVTFASTAVHQLLTAYQDNPGAFTDDFNIPESGNGIPDVLDEVHWEIDWLQRMQYQNGSVALKVGVTQDGNAAPPSHDTAQRFYVPACTSSTVAAAGMFAHSAYVFGKFPALKEVSDTLRARAKAAWASYWSNPASPRQAHCDVGGVHAGNADWSEAEQGAESVTAAVYLFALTGEKMYTDYLKANYRQARAYNDMGWSRYNAQQGEALLFYASLPDADEGLKKTLLTDKFNDVKAGNHIYGFQPDDDLYRAFLHDPQYHWGSNQPRANYGNTNIDAIIYEPTLPQDAATYRARALEILHYFHGVNPFATVYLSNMYEYGATRSVDKIFHTWYRAGSRWSDALESSCGPAPGYLPAGPNGDAAKSLPASISPPAGQPLQKAWRMSNAAGAESSWIFNEPGIYYQSAYIRLLSYFVK